MQKNSSWDANDQQIRPFLLNPDVTIYSVHKSANGPYYEPVESNRHRRT